MEHKDDDRNWLTMHGEKKKFSDITQQHWSNIIHYHTLQIMKFPDREGYVERCIGNVQTGIEQILKRFGGVILPFKKFNPDEIELK